MTDLPQGFSVHVANMGIKDDTNDVMILHCETLATTAGVFTQSRFAGPSVAISRHNVSSGTARAVTVISKNANVATGDTGRVNAEEITQLVAAAVDADPSDVIIGSTGVIGVQYPMERIRSHLSALQVPFLE